MSESNFGPFQAVAPGVDENDSEYWEIHDCYGRTARVYGDEQVAPRMASFIAAAATVCEPLGVTPGRTSELSAAAAALRRGVINDALDLLTEYVQMDAGHEDSLSRRARELLRCAGRENADAEVRELVVLRVDNTPNEDQAYVIGSFYVASSEVEAFQRKAQAIRDQLIESGDDYEESDLVRALEREGYDPAPQPVDITL